MQNIIEKLKKNIEKLRGEISKEDKIMAKLKNQNNELIEKLAKQKTQYDKSLREENAELDKLKKQIEDLKPQYSIVDRKKAQKMEDVLKKTTTSNQILNNNKISYYK